MTRLKICGLRSLDHALAAADSGADLVGFNFVHGVRRRIPPEHAQKIIEGLRRLRPDAPRIVGLFADQPVEDVNAVARRCGLDLAQLCGSEPPEYWKAVHVPVIRQIRVRGGGDREDTIDSTRRAVAEVVSRKHLALLDSHRDGSLGGTGQTFDWNIARAASEVGDYLLAGGLTPDNVETAIITARPWGVDVSSGVETDGVKDPSRIASFADHVRRAAASISRDTHGSGRARG